MNRDTLSLIARFWSDAHRAYYRHVCKSWASWLGVPKKKRHTPFVDVFVPQDDAATYLYIRGCGWPCALETSLDKFLLSENCCRLYRAMIRLGYCSVPDPYKIASILPRFSRPVYEMFDFMFKQHFWSIIWELCKQKRKLTACDLMLYYGTDVAFPNNLASVLDDCATVDRVIIFYEVIATAVELGQKDLDAIQGACEWKTAAECTKLVTAMNHVSSNLCDKMKAGGRHDHIEQYCKRHTQLKRRRKF